MKFVVAGIFIGLFAVYATAENDPDCPLLGLFKQGFEDCSKLMNPSEETVDNIMNATGDDDKDTNCFRACIAKNTGVFEDSKFNIEKLEEALKSAENPDEAKINKIVTGFKNCKEQAEASGDECDIMGNYLKCAKAQQAAAA